MLATTQVLSTATKRPSNPQDTAGWVDYFRWNRQNLLPVPWESSHRLSGCEVAAISRSLAIFQLGESSEGNHFRLLAQSHARSGDDRHFAEAVDLFIAEEQRHAAELGRFLQREGIALRSHQWTDSVFRFLRRFWNLRTCLSVLMTAELVAQIYYKALRNATQSPVLRQICSQLLRDEVRHLAFQANALGRMQRKDGKLRKSFWRMFYRLFFYGTLLIVWLGHKKVFHAGRVSLPQYFRESNNNLARALKTVRKAGFQKRKSAFISHQETITFQTAGAFDFIDITEEVMRIVADSKTHAGMVSVQTKHTTTAILINEKEPLLLLDMKRVLERTVPEEDKYLHNDFSIRTVNMQPGEDKNGHSHCRALFLGSSETIHIIEGQLTLGRWQRIFLVELDHSRQRSVSVTVVGTR